MASVDFIYNGITTTSIQCNENDKIDEILNKFCIKVEQNPDDLLFLYGGDILKVNKTNKTFNEIANKEDKNRKKISILVTDDKIIINENKDSNSKKSEFIICPKCYEATRIKIQDLKIKLYGCKYGHVLDNLSFNDFNNTQIIDESKIICDICKNVNKSKTFDKLFFICKTCNKKICPLCNSTHDKKHKRINYDQKYFKCDIHYEQYNSYCKQCDKNICILCEKEHKTHDKISLGELIPDIDKLNEDKNNLRKSLDEFKNTINKIINKLNDIISYFESYYNIYSDLITEFDIQKRNYQILQNLNGMNEYNNDFIKELNNITSNKIIYTKLENIINIYNKIFSDKYNEKLDKCYIIYNQAKKYYNGKYEGEFKDNKREGKGKFYFNDGDIYEGDYKNDMREGKGITYYKGLNDGDRYEGEYKNDKKEGQGTYYYSNGDKFEGKWKNNIVEKRGIFYWSNGDRYEGEYKNDKAEGKGIMYYNNGDREMGDYSKDNKIGKHVTLTVNGKIKSNYYS